MSYFCMILLVLTAALSGCDSYGVEFQSAGVPGLSPGHTTAKDCIETFGEPDIRTFLNRQGVASTVYTYDYASESMYDGSMNLRKLYVEFIDDTLNGYMFESSFPKESTDFSMKNATRIRNGKTTREDVLQMFGRPSGKIEGRTNLIAMVCGQDAESTLGPDAEHVWAYQYYYHMYEKTDTSKTILLVFGSNGTVVKHYVNKWTRKD